MKKHTTKKEKKAEMKETVNLTDAAGNVLRTITFTPKRRGCAMYITSTKWGPESVPDFCEKAIRAYNTALIEQLTILKALDPARADAVLDALDAEIDE